MLEKLNFCMVVQLSYKTKMVLLDITSITIQKQEYKSERINENDILPYLCSIDLLDGLLYGHLDN